MSSLTIGLEFVTGRCVAADVSDRDLAEWPPHFGRAFMAMAAACFETGEGQSDVAAIKWLETLPSPSICATDAAERSVVSVYVPVNDKLTANKSLLQSVPGLTRSKQERSYPTVIPDDPVVKFVWPDAPNVGDHIDALDRVCSNVIRVGHSSSFVRAWAIADADKTDEFTWQPTEGKSQRRIRVVDEGEFERLRMACNAEHIEQFGNLAIRIEESAGKAKREAKEEFETVFGESYKASLRPPEAIPPVLGMWQGYSRHSDAAQDAIVAGDYFDSQLIVLGKTDGRNVGIQDALALTRRLRDTAMKQVEQPPPGWISGHEPDGSPIQGPHIAFLALPFAGHPYADGHVMGLALAVPKCIPPEDRGFCLRHLLVDENGDSKEIKLKLGGLGIWSVQMEESDTPRRSLQNDTWVAASRSWASVTPVVLDRFPKKSRAKERGAWEQEVVETIALSCTRAGLPTPVVISIDTTATHEGVPRAFTKSRKLRDKRDDQSATSSLGDGFQNMPSRPGKPVRPQIHVYLEFEERVQGPVILGAGRFLGYGLCKPLQQSRNRK
jgi:CRISPR-associated protein Csb2